MASRLFAWSWERFERTQRGKMAPVRDDLLADLQGAVLELGCGAGATFSHYRAGARVIATDYSEHMLKRATDAAREAEADIVVRHADAMALPFEDASFDAVVSSLVLCSVPGPQVALAEVRRVLKPDGHLRLFEHVRSPRRAVAGLQRVVSPVWGRLMDGCQLHRDTEAEVRAAGFSIESVDDVHVAPMRMLQIAARR